MKKRTHISAKSLIIFLRYSFIGMFLLSAFNLAYFLFIELWPALIHSKRQAVNLPIVFSHTEKGILSLPHIDYEYIFRIPQATGTFLAFGLPLKLFYIQSIGTVLKSACILLMLYLIIKMLKSAQNGTLLVAKNAIRLRHIALLSIAILLIDKIVFFVSSAYLRDKLEFPGIEFSSFNWYSIGSWKLIFLFLFLLIIAEAFRLGAQLKEENDLTI